jgi:HK97 family phage major capsid protein
MGRVSIDQLSEMKVELPGRKAAGKAVTEVTGKTVAFVQALMQGDRQKLQLLTEGTAAAGGYLVPEEFANMIVEDKRDSTVMRQLADEMTITSDTLHLPTLDTRPKASWRSEAAVKATSTAQFSELVLTPYSLAVIVGLSQELADDASLGVGGSIVNYVARLMSRSLAEAEDKAFWMGNGSGQPTGINNYSITTIDAGGTDSTLADAIKVAYFRLPQGYRNNAVWVGNSQALERVAKAKDGQNNYLLSRLADSPYPSLNGARVYEQNDLPTDVLYYGDFSYYMIVDRQGVSVDFSTEATVAGSSAFEKNLVYIRVEQRVDGELTLTNAVRKVIGLN